MTTENKEQPLAGTATPAAPAAPTKKLELRGCASCGAKSLTRFCGECGAQVWAPEPGKPDPDGWGPGQPRVFVLDISGVSAEDLKIVKGKTDGKSIHVTDTRLSDKLQVVGAKITDILGTRQCRIPDEREMDGTPIEVVINGVKWAGTMDLTYDEFSNVKNLIHNRKLGDLATRYGNPDVPRKFNFPVILQRGDRA